VAKTRRGFETVGDMVRSLGVVLAVVLVTVLITIRTHGQEVRVVNYTPTLTEARRVAPFAVLAPADLPADWRATSGDYSPSQLTHKVGVVLWHVGYLAPDGKYVGFEQTNDALDQVVAAQLGPAHEDGTSTVDGVNWARWSDNSGRRAIAVTQDKVSLVVHGTADWPELERFAATLRSS